MDKIQILDININLVDIKQAIDIIDGFIKSKKPHQICTVNPEYIMAAQKDVEFKKIINNADLCVPDGAGLIWASKFIEKSRVESRESTSQKSTSSDQRLASSVLTQRVTGIDLIWKLAQTGESKGYKFYFLGGKPGVAEQAALILKTKYPNLKIVGISEGQSEFPQANIKFNKDNFAKKLVAKIKALSPDILLVAYGAPKQDKFIAKFKKELNVPAMIGVGGSFDFISGRIKRAPKWMQKTGLEWLFRLFIEPKRLNRIITATIRFPLKVILSKNLTN
ncbi:MAG: WecB/TagA/CpsF family glycosyltransferase, partial [Patescibacteria group bacterium]|nr:WecB/TagA/CpsF family glycosyltransferase [Patescibacteria group bacterium]